MALGPGYTVVKQDIEVRFSPAPEPTIRVQATYELRNTGNQPLSSLELRLPGRRRFRFADPEAQWDGKRLWVQASPAHPRDVLLTLLEPWSVSSTRTLRLSVDFQRPEGSEDALSFTADAFYLPAQGWSPELLPARGLFATGGVPPKQWNLSVEVPSDFQVHTSGQLRGHGSRNAAAGSEQSVVAAQQPKDAYPFVVAGRFQTAELHAGEETVHLWTRTQQNPEAVYKAANALARTLRAYDAMFGRRTRDTHELWIVECPAMPGCFTHASSNYAALIFEQKEKSSAEVASQDTVMVDFSAGATVIAAGVAPSLASSWLGYDQNPGFFEQSPPLSALPAFAAARGREAAEGPQLRGETIQRALRAAGQRGSADQAEKDEAARAKNFLFFYALQDRFGAETFNKAVSHMLSARSGRGFDIADLIAAFEEETHQNVAEFVRLWMKHPGVPGEFRERYARSEAAAVPPKEGTP